VFERPLQPPSTMDAPNSQFVRVQLSGMSSKSSRRQSSEEDGTGKEKDKAGSSRLSPVTTVLRNSDPGAHLMAADINPFSRKFQTLPFLKTVCSNSVWPLKEQLAP
jgi:hypothetical protein